MYTDISIHNKQILLSYYRDGIKKNSIKPFEPSLFIHTNEKTNWKDIYGKNVKEIEFSSIREFESYKYDFSDTIKLSGNISSMYQYLGQRYNNMKPDLNDIRVLLYDIEVLDYKKEFPGYGFPSPVQADIPVVSIAIKDKKSDIYYVLSLEDFDSKHLKIKVNCKKIVSRVYSSEKLLLKGFINLISLLNPDVLCGWWSRLFDDPYIVNRSIKILGKAEVQRLSPFGRISLTEKTNINGEIELIVKIKGLQLIDYVDLYKQFIPEGRESWSLNFISTYELGEEKVDYTDFENLLDFYNEDYQNFIEYNIYDVELISMLDDKLKLMNLMFTVAYMSKINYSDIFSPIKTFDAIIYNYLREQGIVIPPMKNNEQLPYPGGYVHTPNPGIYKWLITLDLNSLYPHLIMGYNISPETLVDEIEDVTRTVVDGKEMSDPKFLTKEINVNKDYILSASGQYFRKDKKGFAPVLMEEFYNIRKEVKKEMIRKKILLEDDKDNEKLKDEIAALNNEQLARKVLLNSFYGSLGNIYSRYFDLRLSKAITLSGQLAIKWAAKYLEEYLEEKFNAKDTYLYSDTDSVFFSFDFIGKKLEAQGKSELEIVEILDQFSKKYILPQIESSYEDLANYMNVNENKMFMSREKIASHFLISGKKRYAALVWDDEGVRYHEPEMKVTGLQIISSSTPKIIKPFLKESVKQLMLNPDSISKYIREVKEEFLEMKPEDIAFPRSVSNVRKYVDKAKIFKKGCPIGVRAALIYNKYIKDNDIDMTPISDGEKIKFFYCLVPNSFSNSNVFGYGHKIPNRDEILQYTDYSMQFNKVFSGVIKKIAEKVGYYIDERKQTNLDELF